MLDRITCHLVFRAVSVCAIAAGPLSLMSCSHELASDDGPVVEAEVQALTEPLTISLRTPKGVDPLDVTLGADGVLDIGAGAQVTAGSSLALAENTGKTGSSTTTIQLGAKVGSVTSLAPTTVFTTATVQGNLVGPSLTVLPGSTVQGTVDRSQVLEPVTVTNIPFLVPTATSPANVTVALGQTRALAPGRYGSVQAFLGGTLQLSTGVYSFTDLSLLSGSTLALPADGRPVTVVVTRLTTFAGTLTNASSGAGLTLVQSGNAFVTIATQFQGLLLAPAADVTFGVTSQPHRATVFAKNVHLTPLARLDRRTPGALIPLLNPASADLETCINAVRPRPELQGTARERAYQADIGRWCTDQDSSSCLLDIKARVNMDSYANATALVAQQRSPAQYLAAARDRDQKLRAFRNNSTLAAALCNGSDDDGDLVPNASDSCANTPALTATTSNGCPVSTLPTAPSAADMADVLQNMGAMYNVHCTGAKTLPTLSPGAFYRPSDPDLTAFILAGRVTNQPEGCPVWYIVELEDLVGSSDPLGYSIVRSYRVMYMDREEVTSLVGLPMPVPPGYIQFSAKSTDPGTRGFLGSATGGRVGLRFRTKVMNGGGMQSGWSSWKITSNADCAVLGLFCP